MLRNNFENVERNFFFHNDQLQFNHVDMITDEVSHCRTCTIITLPDILSISIFSKSFITQIILLSLCFRVSF